MKFILLLFGLLSASSCRTMGSFSSVPAGLTGLNSRNDSYEPDNSIPYRSNYNFDKYVEERKEQQREFEKLKFQTHDNSDFSLIAGKFIQRHGILDKMGKLGPTFGAEIAIFSGLNHEDKNIDLKNTHGWFLIWTFDHFLKTRGKFLKPDFQSEDYTNYMLGGGYAYRRILSDRFQFHYRGGLAINFIEIDTFSSNDDPDNSKYTDTTISTLHKIGFDYLIQKKEEADVKGGQARVGPSLFYYWAPNPLGKFNSEEDRSFSPGGSLAVMIELKFEIY